MSARSGSGVWAAALAMLLAGQIASAQITLRASHQWPGGTGDLMGPAR